MKRKSGNLISLSRSLCYFVLAGIFFSMNSCADHNTEPIITLKPKTEKPSWAPGIKDEMWAVIEKLLSYGDKPLPLETPEEARRNHTVKDAVMDLLKENNVSLPSPMVDTVGKEIAVSEGTIHARVYTPKTGTKPFPVIVYFHGGGWVIATIDVYDASAQALAEKSGAIVISVEYRKGPEFKFPTAHNDAYTSYLWAIDNAASFNGDPGKIAVAGESAGGNLAANVSIMARDSGKQMPVHQLLIYPVAGSDMTTPSYIKFADAKPLDKPSIVWFLDHFLNDVPKESKDPRIDLVHANLAGLPSTTIISAEIDPLESEGGILQTKLSDAGVAVTRRLYVGTTHEFFGTAILVPDAKDAQDYAASELKKAFGK
ncbi:alpha/beta hydrolase [Dyadobacter sp. CY356]|uniref:alpha/beta hydrolase n=1 Tax=Dyadobacter sp. CY356 TaxID=2906442 RepID=UPI001F191229|nr:alpha/beta hydrolase [Dyadobacter sp. CY356]MCF0057091.1 alpha/beta hydrolase [Dyadobacter sp. CY356]